ncbi:unnamed protein product [Amoebophrya sp. A25]|nr:unnamed protein product [Amoebophrya sp. A25]|eukprot:GSA25T00017461001.1
MSRDTLEVWICGPCFDGQECGFKIATASITCEKDAMPTKEEYAEVKLHSDVFCGRDGISVEESDVLRSALPFLSGDGGAGLPKLRSKDGKTYSGVIQTDRDEVTPATKAQILEQTNLHKGLSPEGIPYRLSDAFDRFPAAYVGRKRFQLSVLGDFNFEMAGRIENRHIPVLHYFAPDYQLEVPVKHLAFPRKDYYSHFYSQMKENQRWNFLFSRIITLFSILAVIYMGKAQAAVSAGASEIQHLTEHQKKLALAASKHAAEMSSGYSQLVALLVGTFVTFGTAAWPDVNETYKEKEEERLNELRDANMKESKKLCGLVAMYDKLMWFSQKQHRYFAIDAVYDGAAFMYAAEVALILILLLGHPGSPFVIKIPTSLDAWLLIFITGFTLVRLNGEFLSTQWERAKKKIAEADDRLLAEYEEKLKIYEEKKKQVGDMLSVNKWKAKIEAQKAKYQGKIDAVQEKIERAFATADNLRQMAEKRAKAAEEELRRKKEQGLLDDGDTDEEMETEMVGKVNESPAKAPLLEKGGAVEMTSMAGDTSKATKVLAMSAPAPRRVGDEGATKAVNKSAGLSTSCIPLTARTFEKLNATERSHWEEWTVIGKDTTALSVSAPAVESIVEVTKKGEFVVIPGKKASTELSAITGLSQQGPWRQAGKIFRLITKVAAAPITLCLSKEMYSKLCTTVLAPGVVVLGGFYILAEGTTSTIMFTIQALIIVYVAKAIHRAGVNAVNPSDAELEQRKLAEKARLMLESAALDSKKVTSIHTMSILSSTEAINEKEHVESALQAAEAVDASWAKGEHTFTKMPPQMARSQKKPTPDVNRGWFALNEKHFQPAKPPEAQEIGTTLNSDDMFTTKDYVFESVDIVVDSLGLRLPSDVKPVRHTKGLSKKLLQVNKPLGTTRDLVKSFPIQISVDMLKGEDAAQSKKQTQVACTLQIVNFVGKGEADRPDNDSYLTLTDQKTIGGKKGAGVNLDIYKMGDEVILQDVKVGDLFQIEGEGDDEVTMIPKLAGQNAFDKASNGMPLSKDDITFVAREPLERAGADDGGPASPKRASQVADAVDWELANWKKPQLLELRPEDTENNGLEGTIYEIENTYGFWSHVPKDLRGKPLPQNMARFKIKAEGGSRYSFSPVRPGPPGQALLCRKEGELSLEEGKAKKCADWFNEVDGWLETLGASTNLRSNVHNVFDELFWGKDTTVTGGRPADATGERKAFKKGERKDLIASQKGLLARVQDRKDAGMTVKEYFDYLMYGAENDAEWPGFIYWFRFKAKAGKTPTQLNKHPKFREGPVVAPGPIVAALAKPALTPQVLHVVLTDSDLRAPGDVVDAWQPQRGEPHTAELFKMDKDGFARGEVGLLKLLPDKLQFELPAGDGTVDEDAMADTLNFDFSDTYGMFPVKMDTFKRNAKTGMEELQVTGKTLYLLMKSGDIVAFGMDAAKITMWADLVEKYQMSVPQQFILGYDGEAREHPEDPNLQIREGKQGYQKFYMKSKTVPGYLPKSRYCGSWKSHKFHGDGIYFKLQVSEKCPHQSLYPGSTSPLGHKMQDVYTPGDDKEQVHHAKAFFERQVVQYDGNFENGLRSGKGMAYFAIETSSKKKLTYRFNGIWAKDRPVLGELMLLDGEVEAGSSVIKYYFGTVVPLNEGKGTTGKGSSQFMKNALMDVSPVELFGAACLSCGQNAISPSQALYQLKKDYAFLMGTKNKKLCKLLGIPNDTDSESTTDTDFGGGGAIKDELNRKIEETRRTYGFYDEPLGDFDVYVLSRLLEPLKKLPMFKNLMDADPSSYFRDGLNVNDYKFPQRLNVKEYHCDEYIREDLDALYRQWFKFDCVNGDDPKQGTVYAIDTREDMQWDQYKKGMANLAEDWKAYKKEIPYEDACMLMEMGRKKKPKWMSTAQQKKFCEELLLQGLPCETSAPPWYTKVSGEVYAEVHWESKEYFRSLSRKLSAIFPTAFPSFTEELWDKLPVETKKVTDKKLQGTFASGTDLDVTTNFTNYMGRLLQVNGVVDDAGLVAEFRDDSLGMYEGQDDPWVKGQLYESLKNKLCLNGYMCMKTVDDEKKVVDFAAPMVNGACSGKDAFIGTADFSYAGDYKAGKFDGRGVLNVKPPALRKFKGVSKYKGEWKGGLKHGEASMEHISGTEDVTVVEGTFKDGQLQTAKKVEYTCKATPKDSWRLVEEKGEKYFVFAVDGSQGEVKYKVPKSDLTKLKGKTFDFNGSIDVSADGAIIKGTVQGHKLNGKGVVQGATGKYDGDYSGNKRTGAGVWTFGQEADFPSDGVAGNYKGTVVTCDGLQGKFENDKPTGKFKVELVKDGKPLGTLTCVRMPTDPKVRVNPISCPPACCAAPLPEGMLDSKFPDTQALPFGAKGGLPLEFNDVSTKMEIPAVLPWGQNVQF